MKKESTKKAKNIMERIRKLLENIELSIKFSETEIKIRDSIIKKNTNLPRPRHINAIKVKEAEIEKLKCQIYIQELERHKRELIAGINLVLDQFAPIYKEIFIMYYFQKATYREIAEKINYSFDYVNKRIQELNKEIMNFYD